ncbi:PAQR family membrane homeostasis protein TrhA [Tepidanaerobacter syntrophicus]|uniref:Hemolysin III n=1 Tax=Tepidanaerobacter syntrophicus TaxID=224999 RepID=A0A0U9I2Q9_9FIRM|nr:hemolysin III family protein [Tepidanaerobacter syntrophicus]GAQ24120.1 hemolysin III [Tepidanaerobacter syntrophicus]GLI19571.1 hemolysin III [Tepidanaerobacter syntrophicus]
MREPVNTWTHFITFLAGIAGLVYLIIFSYGDLAKLATMGIYGASIVILYGASTAYHWANTTPEKQLILRKFDHISIFILIAGTYTPVLYYGLEGTWRWAMLAAIWGLSLVGIIIKIFFLGIQRWVSTMFYIILGWMAIIPMSRLIQAYPKEAMLLLFLGGLSYTIGGIIYATKIFNFIPNKFGFHEVFHIFISIGSLLHFVMIAKFILPM